MRIVRFPSVSLVFAILLSFALSVSAGAQTAHFSYAQVALGGGLTHPQGVAVDGSGNVFVADAGSNLVKEIPSGCTSDSCVRTLGSGFNSPKGITVDNSGNVFVADSGNAAVKEILAVNGSIPNTSPTINTLGSGFSLPNGVAVDAAGNVYVADGSPTVHAVKEILAAGGYVTVNTLSSGFVLPDGVAVDKSGNVYVADNTGNAVKEILAVKGSIPASPTVNTLASSYATVGTPTGVAVDGIGNVFFSELNTSAVKEILAINGTIPASPTILTLNSSLSAPNDIAVDRNGNVVVADHSDGVVALETREVSFGKVAAGQTSTAITLTFTIDSAGAIGSPVALTQGATGLDFAVASGGSCTSGASFNSGDTCTVNATFKPLFTGTRHGAVVLYDSSSPAHAIGTAYLEGIGTGAQVAFQPSTLSSPLVAVNTSFNWLGGIAVDGSENLYLADGLKAVWLLTAPGSGTNYTSSLLGGMNGSSVPNISYDCPQYTAADGAGNIYVADYGCNTSSPAVYQLALQSNGSYIKNPLGSAWVNPMGVAVDGAGTVYVTDIGNGHISKLTPSNGSYTQQVIASGIANLNDLAVDSNGNVFAAIDWGTVNGSFQLGSVIKLTPSGSGYAQSTIVSGLYAPSEIAVDGNGNLFVADNGGTPNTAYKLTLQTDGSYVESPAILYTQLKSPVGIAVDGAANLFVVDGATNNVFKLDAEDGPTLSFPTATAHGSTDTADGTLTATIQNIGNAPLTFSSIVASTHFKLDSGMTTCSTSASLAVNATCVVGVIFAPASAGALQGTITLTDNALSGTQTIPLSGSGSILPPAPVIASGPVGSTTAATAALTFSDTQSGVTFQCSLDSAAYAACTSPANYTSLALGTHNFSVEAVDASNNVSAPATYSWTVINPPPAPTLILHPASSTTATTATFNFLDGLSNETNQCSLDGAAYTACGATDGNPNGTIVYTSLSIGAHTFAVEAVDGYGNVSSPTTFSWTITAVPVHVTISTSPSGLSFTVDGTSYSNSTSLNWAAGSVHTIATTSSQSPTGIQATFVSWSDGGDLSHTVTATAGTTSYTATFTASYLLATAANPANGGVVSPVSGAFYPSGTVVNLTATPNDGFPFGFWSGSVANSGSASTTVTMSAPLNVTANFYPVSAPVSEWTWEGGNSTGNKPGAYGTLKSPSPDNIPGGRSSGNSWTDSSGNLWIFGGKGYDSTGTLGLLNDLWEFSPSTGWAWMGGSSTVGSKGGQPGTYGTLGTPDVNNVPGGRQYAVSWTDSGGNFWLFGGNGYDSAGTSGALHDLWKFDLSTKMWTWMSGTKTIGNTTGAGGQLGIYGTLGSFDPLNLPGSRQYAVGWADSSGNLWLFGGQGYDSKGTLGYLNDLWEFNPSLGATGQWAWMGGGNTASKYSASYGSKGSAASSNVPGGRLSATSWSDESGNFWLFGGEGYDANGVFGELNDLWEFNPASPSTGWMWVSGGNTTIAYSGLPGIYGTLGVPAAGNMPGDRQNASSWIDSSGKFWLFGGLGLDVNGNSGQLGDLWEFDPVTSLWTWMGDSNTIGSKGIYGTLKTPAAGDAPGARYFAARWIDKDGNPWIFGGYGKDANGSNGYLNDLWTVGVITSTPPPAPTIDTEPANPTTATTAAFTFSDTQAGVTYQCSLDGAAYSACVSGLSYSPLAVGSHTFAVEALAGAGNNSATTSYSWIINVPPTVATPQISPAAGTYNTDQSVTIADTTAGAVICYTIDNSTPSASNGTCSHGATFGSAISVAQTGTTVQAIATVSGSTNSAVASATYTLQAAAPELNPPGGTYSGAQSVTLSTTTAGSQIYYTTDGSTPATVTPSIHYNGAPISVATSGTVINAVAIVDGYLNSTVSTGTYTLQFPAVALTPSLTFTANTGTTSAPQSATLQNTGNAPLTGIAISIAGTNPSDFAQSATTCGSTLAAGSSCTISITFTPASAASFSATISVSDNASGSPQTAILSGTGTTPIVSSFSVTSTTPAQTVQPGSAATYAINVNPVNGTFSSIVTLSASGLPSGTTAIFSPATVTPGASGASSQLTVQTASTTASNARNSAWPLAMPALGLLGLCFVPGKRRRRWITLGIFLLASLGALTALSGCGGGFAGFGHTSESYIITVTGTSGTIQQSTTVQLTVQ